MSYSMTLIMISFLQDSHPGCICLMKPWVDGNQLGSLARWFFDLHGGGIFGLPGRLLIDGAGIVFILLSISGLTIRR